MTLKNVLSSISLTLQKCRNFKICHYLPSFLKFWNGKLCPLCMSNICNCGAFLVGIIIIIILIF
jgi:hypothetical protein